MSGLLLALTVVGGVQAAETGESAASLDEQARILRQDAAWLSTAGQVNRARDLLRLAASVDSDRLDAPTRDALLAQCRSVAAAADDHAKAGRAVQAAALLESAAAVVRTLAARSQEPGLMAEAERLVGRARAIQATAAAQAQAQAADDRHRAQRNAWDQAAGDETHRNDTRTERLARVRALEARAQYDAALTEARRLVLDAPGDAEVADLHARLMEARHEQRRLDDRQRADDLREELDHLTERSLLPTGSDGLPVFPSDWERRARRSADRFQADAMPAWELALRNVLTRRTALRVEGAPGNELLARIAREERITIVVDPKVAATNEIQLTLSLPDIRLDHLLTWITASMGTRWSLVDGAIYVGPVAADRLVTRVHDINALLFRGTDAPTRALALTSGSGQGSSLFAANAGSGGKALTAEEVVDLLRSAVNPQGWKQEGAGIIIRGGNLLVTASPETQRLLEEFIRSQQQQQVLQVRVEARWLEVADGFLEEVGVDWTGAGSLLSTRFGDGAHVERQDGLLTGSVASILPATAMTINPVTAGTGLALSAKFLGVDQLSMVLRAVERSQKARVLQQSSVTTLNGVRASVFDGAQLAYLGSYEVVSGNLDPQIKMLSTGLNLEVRPLVSADRKYVTLEIAPTIATAELFVDTMIAPRILGQTPTGDGDRERLRFSPSSYPIELPNVFVRSLGTAVTLPDRGSVLMGGFGKALDEFAVARVPYLGSLPFLGRLFSTRGRYSDHRQLYLLTSTTIISYDELEAKL